MSELSMYLPESQALSLVFLQLIQLFYPAVVTSVGLTLAGRQIGFWLPTWASLLLTVFSVPLVHTAQIRLRSWQIARKAARPGAQLPPRVQGKKIGNYDILIEFGKRWDNGYLSEAAWETMQNIGHTFEAYVLWDRCYVTSDMNIIKSILATDFNNWVKGDKFEGFMRSVLGTGVFNADGDMWKFHRTMTRPFFTRERISHFDLFDRHAEEVMVKTRERLREGYAVDIQDLMSRFTLDSATEFLFGSCVNSLSSILPYPFHAHSSLRQRDNSPAEQFATAFTEAQEAVNFRVRMGPSIWPWFELFGSKTKGPMRIVDAFLDPILKAAVEKARVEGTLGTATTQDNKEEIGEDDTLLDHLVKYTDDPKVLHDEVLNIMIAGRDTTAGMLTIAVYFLTQYPDVLRRLREEILEKVGPSRRPDYDDIREMKYLRAVINETLRLYPAVPWNVRYPVQDTLIPSEDPSKPYFIPADTPLQYSVQCMQRRTDYWGPDAEEFDPDRFLDERVSKYLTPNPFIFLPFNAGPRICLGQQFAYNEMSFLLVRLLQNFSDFTLDLDSHPPDSRVPSEWAGSPGRRGVEKFWGKMHLTMYAKGGMWVKMRDAQAN